jgi:ankyrin repeat protein
MAVDSMNTTRATPLIHTSIDKQVAVMRLLLDTGEEVNAQDIYGDSLLSLAAEYGHDESLIFDGVFS